MMNSPNFDPKQVEDWIAFFPEGVFLDFKIQPPILEEGVDSKFTFAKHLIAFGNIARTTNRECHIVFGVADDNRIEQKDLRDFYNPADIKEWDEQTSIHKKQADGVEERIRKIAENWIRSEYPNFSLAYGELPNGKFLSYLKIYPTQTSQPFSLKKTHKSYPVGTVFVRRCSASVSISQSQIEYLLPISESVYFSRYDWQRFFQYHTTGEFLEAQDILPAFFHKTKEDKDALQEVMKAIQTGKKTILIKGAAGQGKTTLLRRVAYKLANSVHLIEQGSRNDLGEGEDVLDEETYIVRSFTDEMSNSPKASIPVYMSLRTAFHNPDELDKLLLRKIEQDIVEKSIKKVERLFKDKSVSWILLLDGVDEIRNMETAGPVLSEWLQLLPDNVQVVITSRPYASSDMVSIVIELAALQSDEILYLIKGKVQATLLSQDNTTIDKVLTSTDSMISFIQNHSDFLEFINRHRAIDGLLNYLRGSPFSPAILNNGSRTLVKVKDVILSENHEGELPTVGRSDELNKDVGIEATGFEDTNSPQEKSDDNETAVGGYRLVEMLNVVYEYLRLAEIDRQRQFGHEAKKESDDAAHKLSRAAWHGDWQKNELNMEKAGLYLDEKSLDWNQFAGFLHYKKMPFYEYCCDLFHKFLIAEYGYEHESKEMPNAIQIYEEQSKNSALKIKELYNEFCEWRGQKTLLI